MPDKKEEKPKNTKSIEGLYPVDAEIPIDILGTKEEIQKEVERIEYLNYNNEKQLKIFKGQLELIKNNIALLENIIPVNEGVIDYLKSRIQKPK